MRHRARDSENLQICTLCRHFGLLFAKRLDTIFLRHRIRIYPDRFTRPHVIGFVADLFFFSTLESEFKNIRIRCRIRRMRVDGSRILKEKVADSKISGYVWTGPYLTPAPTRAPLRKHRLNQTHQFPSG